MAKISILSSHEANKIAAGEVVERPAHMLKELLENALDADATHITLYIENGGKTVLRVIDNGIGMDEVDARLCFEKHATSKISRIEDLNSIATFGFRGEALASIAAVARVFLKTKERTAQSGVEVAVEQGVVRSCKEISMNSGTDISIQDLFYAIPARKKFLKSDASEWRHIQQVMHAFCLAYKDVQFVVYVDGRQMINVSPAETLQDRWRQLWPEQRHEFMMPLLSVEKGVIQVEGVISHYQETTYDRSGIFFFVNNRLVKNIQLHRALMRGYDNLLPAGKFCRASIHITCPIDAVDINIHPRKEEVKFVNPRIVEQLISTQVKQALEQRRLSTVSSKTLSSFNPTFFMGEHRQPEFLKQPTSWHNPVQTYKNTEKIQHSIFHAPKDTAVSNVSVDKNGVWQSHFDQQSVSSVQETVVGEAKNANVAKELVCQAEYIPLVQYHKTYILCQHPDGLFLVDQHAAHERILYQQFASRFTDLPTIALVAPQIITIRSEDMELIVPYIPFLVATGIGIEQCDDTQLLVRSTPVCMRGESYDDLIKQMIGWVVEYEHIEKEELEHLLHDKIRAMMACKAAVKAGDVLTKEQMQLLVNDLEQSDNKNSCPHGRPTGWLIPLYEIEKKFKRKK